MSLISVRMDQESSVLLRRLSEQRRQNHSEVIRDAIANLAQTIAREPTAYDLMKDGIGIFHSGDGALARDHGSRFAERLREQHARETVDFLKRKKKRGRG